jgi:tetratricopeptide (TPR) repeat protein
MKKSLFFLFISCIFFGGICYGETASNEIPMYGNIPFNAKQKIANENLFNDVVQKCGSRNEGAKSALKVGWNSLSKNDPKKAMRRFNQAWLLDPDNAEVYYAFGFLVSLQGNLDEGITLYNKALKIDPGHAMTLAGIGYTYKEKARILYDKKNMKEQDAEVKGILKEALAFYEKAAQTGNVTGYDLRLSSLDQDLSYIYCSCAILSEVNGEYAKAWKYIKLLRKHGGSQLLDPDFIKELSGFMPEPKS